MVAPLVEELAGPGGGDIIPELVEVFLEKTPSGLFQKRLIHHPPRHPAGHCQIRDQRRQLRPELSLHFFRQLRRGWPSAPCTLQLVTLIFRDVRFDLRQPCYLMPLRRTLRRPRAVTNGFLAMAALRGIHGMHCVYPLRGKQAPMMSRVSRLPAGFATALLSLTDASGSLLFRQPVGRRWPGGCRRVLQLQAELPFQLGVLLVKSAICRSCSETLRLSLLFLFRRRSFSSSNSRRRLSCGTSDVRCLCLAALKHSACQVFFQSASTKCLILQTFLDAKLSGLNYCASTAATKTAWN